MLQRLLVDIREVVLELADVSLVAGDDREARVGVGFPIPLRAPISPWVPIPVVLDAASVIPDVSGRLSQRSEISCYVVEVAL